MITVSTKIAKERLSVCMQCKYFKANTKSCGTLIFGNDITEEVNNDETNIVTYRRKKVRLCGCRMPVKTYLALASCPIGKWNRQLSNEDMESFVTFVNEFKIMGRWKDDDIKLFYKWIEKIKGVRQQVYHCSSCIRKSLNEILKSIEQEYGSTKDESVLAKNEPEQPSDNQGPQVSEISEVD
jgi:hypothetical protein